MQMGDLGRELGLVRQLAYTIEFARQPGEPALLDALLVHARGVIIADLAGDRIAPGLGLGRSFQDLAERLLVALVKFVEASPARLIGRYWIVFQPRAAFILVEILARI